MPRRKIDWYGHRLRSLRIAAELSQAELGKRVGLAGSQINKLETNVNQPTLATALALAEAMGVSIADFCEGRQAGIFAVEEPAPRPRGRPKKEPAPAEPRRPRRRPRKAKDGEA